MKPWQCRAKIVGAVVTTFMLFFGTVNAQAAPFWWETNFGSELTNLTAEDDEETGAVSLSFLFPFAGTSYSDIYVGNNGGLQLGSLGDDDDIDYDIWEDFGEFLDDAAPSIHAFNTDLDLDEMGMVFFNDFGDHAVITWDEVGSFENEFAPFTFQIQLLDNGKIFMAWNGIPTDLQTDLDEGIIVGITPGDHESDPGTSHFLTDAPFSGGTTIYEIWCYDTIGDCDNIDGDQENPTTGFPLDGKTLMFTPNNLNGYDVAFHVPQGPAPVPEPGTILLLTTGLVGLVGYRRFAKR